MRILRVLLAAAALAFANAAVAAPVPPAGPATDSWWRIFGDETLERLIGQGERGSPTIEAAAARLARAQAFVRVARANRLPRVGLGADATAQSGPLVNAAGDVGSLYQTGVSAGLDFDIFGRLAKANKAARLDVQSRQALLAAARLTVDTQIAQTYFEIRALDSERAVLASTGVSYAETVRVLEGRRASGLDPETTLDRARAELATVRSEALALDRRRTELEHALAAFVGAPAQEFRLPPAEIASDPPVTPSGLPSNLLERRADIVAASLATQSAKTRVSVARLSWLPTLSLTASGGYASPDLIGLLSASARSFGVSGLLALPLLDGGRRAAELSAARADADLAAAQQRESALTAFRDVADQISAVTILAEQAQVVEESVAADLRATRAAEARFGDGLASRLEVLDAHRVQLRDQRMEAKVRGDRYVATVGLIRALGGGWDMTRAPTSGEGS